MKKCYVCYSGGYDSTLLLYELCLNAISNKTELEIFPVYLQCKNRPDKQEIYHSNKSINYFSTLFKNNSIIIRPLLTLNFGEIKRATTESTVDDNNFKLEHLYYSNFLVNVAQLFSRKDVFDVFFGFHQGDGIFSYIKDFECAINALRRLLFFSNNSGKTTLSNELFFNDCRDLTFHYPLKNVVKKYILKKFLDDPKLADKKLAFACECLHNRFDEENKSYLSELHCDKCKEIGMLFPEGNESYYFFNEINKDQIDLTFKT